MSVNKNKCELVEIIKRIDAEYILLKYIPDPGDSKFDDLPSELLTIGEQYYTKFTPVKKEQEEEFNKK